MTKTNGSDAFTPKRRPASSRVRPNAATIPMASPATARRVPCNIIIVRTPAGAAPKARRIPISRVRSCTQELHDTVGIGVGQRLQQDRVDHGEDGGVRTDAQRQGRQCREREPGRAEQLAKGTHSPTLCHSPIRCRSTVRRCGDDRCSNT